MSRNDLVTSKQTDAVRRMAHTKGITRANFQEALKDGRVSSFLDSFKVDLTALTPPLGARLYVVRIHFKPNRKWQEVVHATSPHTPSNYNIWKVGDQYPPIGTKKIKEDLVLLNFSKGNGLPAALKWAQSKGLEKTIPYEVFAIGEQHPKLYKQLGQYSVYVAETKTCIFGLDRYACCVWLGNSQREVRLGWVGDLDRSDVWFAFRMPVKALIQSNEFCQPRRHFMHL